MATASSRSAASRWSTGGTVGRRLHHYVNPQRASHPDALRVHGITDDFLADKPLFAAVAEELLAFVAGAEIVIHNAGFDIGFIDAELDRLGLPPFRAARRADHRQPDAGARTLPRQEQQPGRAVQAARGRQLATRTARRAARRRAAGRGLPAHDARAEVAGHRRRRRHGAGSQADESIDLRRFELPVLQASSDEAAAHEAVLAEIDKASKGKTVWREAAAA